MTTFNSSNMDYEELEIACQASSPSLKQIDDAYGSGSAVTWIVARLTELADFVGIRENFTDRQVLHCANKIRKMGYHIKVSELMAFFVMFENGEFEIFKGYKNPNGQLIMHSFSEFMTLVMKERTKQAEQEHSQIRELEKAQHKPIACPPEMAERFHKAYMKTKWKLPERDRKRSVNPIVIKKQ